MSVKSGDLVRIIGDPVITIDAPPTRVAEAGRVLSGASRDAIEQALLALRSLRSFDSRAEKAATLLTELLDSAATGPAVKEAATRPTAAQQAAEARRRHVFKTREQLAAMGGVSGDTARRWASILLEQYWDVVAGEFVREAVKLEVRPDLAGLLGHARWNAQAGGYAVTVKEASLPLALHELAHCAGGHVVRHAGPNPATGADGRLDEAAVLERIGRNEADESVRAFAAAAEDEARLFVGAALKRWGFSPAHGLETPDGAA